MSGSGQQVHSRLSAAERMMRKKVSKGDSWEPTNATKSFISTHYEADCRKPEPEGWTTVVRRDGKGKKATKRKSKRKSNSGKKNPARSHISQRKSARQPEGKHSPSAIPVEDHAPPKPSRPVSNAPEVDQDAEQQNSEDENKPGSLSDEQMEVSHISGEEDLVQGEKEMDVGDEADVEQQSEPVVLGSKRVRVGTPSCSPGKQPSDPGRRARKQKRKKAKSGKPRSGKVMRPKEKGERDTNAMEALRAFVGRMKQ